MELHRRYGNYVRIGEQFPLDLESNRDIMLTWTQVQMIFQSLMSTRFPRCLGRMGCPRANVCDHCTLTVKDYAQFSEILRVFGSAGSTRTEQSLYTDRRGARESTPTLNRGMSSESLIDYEPMIVKRSHELVEFLRSSARFGSIDLDRAIGYFTFDFMGDMAYVSYRFCASETDGLILTFQRFGQSFSMLTSGDAEERWDIVERFSM